MLVELRLSAPSAARAASRFPGAAWLDGDGRARDGRLGFVACAPVEVVRVEHADAGTLAAVARALDGSRPRRSAVAGQPPRPRWIGFLGYEAGRALERRTDDRRPAPAEPAAWWARYDAVARFDHGRGVAVIEADDAGAAARLADRLRSPAPRPVAGGPARGALRSDASRARHEANVRAALERIAAGEVYQLNVTRLLELAYAGDGLGLALAMRRASPVPYGLFLDAGDLLVVGRSPELYLRWDRSSGLLVTRPIKGTLARAPGRSLAEAERALRADPKEHAEHVMIVDMARNDLGRVAITGSVEVPELLQAERFARLDHLVSTVCARTAAGTTLADVLGATFPGASVTGAPKVAAMDAIARLEVSRRGLYTGAYGYLADDGSLVLAMAIRTAVLGGGRLRYGTGGGVVAASDPTREWEESELKARALLDALDAGRRARGRRVGAPTEPTLDGP